MANQAGMPLDGRAGGPQEPVQQPARRARFQDEDDPQDNDSSPKRNKRLSSARDSEGEPLIPKFVNADDDEDVSSEEGSHRMEHVQLLGSEKVIVDDRAASFVLVFPRQKQRYKGQVDPTATNKNPREAWERIFGQQLEVRKKDRVPPELKKGPVTEGLYQALVRQKILQILQESGLKAESIESIDQDEVFLKIAFDIDGRMIHKLAETFQYKMPFKAECYANEPKFGSYPGGRPMKNNENVPVPLYAECSEDLQDKLEGFRHVDEVRLIIKHLASCMDLVEMEKQKVITRHFPGANFMSVQRLNSEWSLFHNLLKVPTDEFDQEIRDYFGEEVAFFFKWFALYLRFLAVLGALGLFASIGTFPQLGLDLSQRDHVLVWFGLALVVWETVFQQWSKANITRAAQVWGMTDYDATEDSLSSYNPTLEGTSLVSLRRSALTIVMLIYVILFSVIIFWLNVKANAFKMHGMNQLAALQPIVQTAIVKFLSFTWRKIAFRLVLWQNHRTRTRFNNTLVKSLIIVKLFVALYPFFFTAFLRRYWTSTCGTSLSEAAHKVYGLQDWPQGVQIPFQAAGNQSIPEADLGFLDGFSYMQGNQTCISGCYPVVCESNPELECVSSCMLSMQESLKTLYFTHIGLTLFNILVPIFWTRHVIYKELQKVQRRNGGREVPYSFLQIQAKCPEYHFTSWGGSFVEDFLELIVSYALLACFGVCYPLMATIGFVCLLAEYRLLAYRMTNVTCRPEPRGKRGLGLLDNILEAVSILAVSFNAGIVVTLMMPYRTWPLGRQLGMFVLAEKGLLVLRSMIAFVVPGDCPADVMLIGDFNASIKKKLLQSDVFAVDESADWSQVKVGLEHDPGDRLPGDNSGEEAEESEGWENGKSSDSDKDAFC